MKSEVEKIKCKNIMPLSRAEQSRAEQSRAEQSRAEQSRAEQRDYSVDLLRAFGLLLLILAHVNPPNVIFQLRCMDVPLMVFLSGISFSLSTKQIASFTDYKNYVVKRFKRLIIPAWIFIVIFLAVFGAFEFAGIGDEKFSLGLTARSFLLIDGVGYVWVIRVYFLIALIAPLMKNFLFVNCNNKLDTLC